MEPRAPSFARRDGRLAGRTTELGRLEQAWRDACDGVWRVAIVGGEPGIGKTRLSAEVAALAHAEGGVALYGRCDEESIVPYQPFVEALRPTLHRVSPTVHGTLSRLFGELTPTAAPAPAPTDPEAERYRLFDAMSTLLSEQATAQPTVLILDDLQWADAPTLQLFRHVMRTNPRGSLLVLACYRDTDVHAGHPWADVIADLHRDQPSLIRVTLAGLSENEAGDLLDDLASRELARPLVAALHAETAGNPFFLVELLRHLVDTDALSKAAPDVASLDVPDTVRELVTRRVRRLPDAATQLLSVAAVVGQQFDAPLLARASDAPQDQVVEDLDHAIAAGLVHEDPAGIERYSFAHALVRQALTAELGVAQRVRLHADVANALEEMASPEHRASVLARHFVEAVPLTGATKAIDYTVRAGHDALAELAFEDAGKQFGLALDLLDRYAPSDTAQRVALLIARASALVYVDETAGVDAARVAVDAARADGSAAQFAQAVTVFVEPVYAVEMYPDAVASLFDEVRAVLGEGEPALRARLLAYEAFKYIAHQLQGGNGQGLAEEAVALAREVGDPVALADGLLALASSLEGRPEVVERAAIGEELVALAEHAGPRASAFGHRVLASVHLETGRSRELAATIDELAKIGDESRWIPAHAYAAQWRATQALLEGRFDDVRAAGSDLRRYARSYRGAGGVRLFQAFHLAREIGDLTEVPVGDTEDAFVRDLYLSATRALLLLEAGDTRAASQRLGQLIDAEFTRYAADTAWGPSLGLLAEVAAGCGERAHAAVLYEQLRPFKGRLLSVYLGIACLGAADRYLGMLSTTLEHWDDAELHFQAAEALELSCNGAALLQRTRVWHARSLRARGTADDLLHAHDVLSEVEREASALGMRKVAADAGALRSVRG